MSQLKPTNQFREEKKTHSSALSHILSLPFCLSLLLTPTPVSLHAHLLSMNTHPLTIRFHLSQTVSSAHTYTLFLNIHTYMLQRLSLSLSLSLCQYMHISSSNLCTPIHTHSLLLSLHLQAPSYISSILYTFSDSLNSVFNIK